MKKWLFGCLTVFLLAGCSGEEGKEGKESKSTLEKVTIVLDWTPNTNHTGLYIAENKGFFKEQGLDVEIMLPGEARANQLVASGKADFGISSQEYVVQARDEGIPLVSIAAIIQHNTSGFASPAAKNIRKPKDFAGKTYGGWGAPIEKQMMQSLMEADKANVDQVNFLNIGNSDYFTAVKRDIDFAWIYYGWTGIEAEIRGEEMNMIYLTDFAKELDYYSPLLTANEDQLAENPEKVKKFLAAASKGYKYAINEPEAAAEILLDEVPDLDSELVKKSQKWLSAKYQDDAEVWGEQEKSRWDVFTSWMLDNKLINTKIDVDKAFTNDFLPE